MLLAFLSSFTAGLLPPSIPTRRHVQRPLWATTIETQAQPWASERLSRVASSVLTAGWVEETQFSAHYSAFSNWANDKALDELKKVLKEVGRTAQVRSAARARLESREAAAQIILFQQNIDGKRVEARVVLLPPQAKHPPTAKEVPFNTILP